MHRRIPSYDWYFSSIRDFYRIVLLFLLSPDPPWPLLSRTSFFIFGLLNILFFPVFSFHFMDFISYWNFFVLLFFTESARQRRRQQTIERIEEAQEMTRIIHHSLLNDEPTARQHHNHWKALISRWVRVSERGAEREMLREREREVERGIER